MLRCRRSPRGGWLLPPIRLAASEVGPARPGDRAGAGEAGFGVESVGSGFPAGERRSGGSEVLFVEHLHDFVEGGPEKISDRVYRDVSGHEGRELRLQSDQLDGVGDGKPIPFGIAGGHDRAAGSRQPRLAAMRWSTLTRSA